jgi:DNA replication protein DnaC
LVLIGNPGTGKTQMVMAFLKDVLQLKPMIINNMDGLRFYDNNVNDAIIFDDCN